MLDLKTEVRPGLGRYVACLAYESILVAAWLFVVAAVLTLVYQVTGLQVSAQKTGLSVFSTGAALLFFLGLMLALAGYFCFFWARGGQTLAMKTWHLRLVSLNGAPPSALQSLARFLMAAMFIPLFGLAWLWAFGSKDGLWLHDQVSRTVLIRA